MFTATITIKSDKGHTRTYELTGEGVSKKGTYAVIEQPFDAKSPLSGAKLYINPALFEAKPKAEKPAKKS